MPKTDLVSPPSHCALCPRRCGVDRAAGAVGFCGAGRTLKAARAALHFWEEPCISGTRGSGTVFFSGCTLKCCFCQNYPISAEGLGKEISVEHLAEIFLSLQAQGAHNINLIPSGFKQTETFDSVSVWNKVFDKLDNLLFFQTVGAAEND